MSFIGQLPSMIGLAPEVSCAVHTFTRHFPDTDAVGRGLPPLEGSAATKFDRSRLSKPWLGWVVGIPLYLRRGVARLGRADIRGRRTRQILVRRLGPRDDGLKSPQGEIMILHEVVNGRSNRLLAHLGEADQERLEPQRYRNDAETVAYLRL